MDYYLLYQLKVDREDPVLKAALEAIELRMLRG